VHVLVVGGTRFMGALTVWRLLARGERVTLMTRGLAKDDFGDHVERLVADRTSDDFAARLAGRRFDAVIDFIAFDGRDVRGVIDALGARAGHYVLVSSGQVYLVREGVRSAAGHARLATEDDYDGPLVPRPDAPTDAAEWDYGMGKRAAEDALVAAAARFPATRVRLPMVHGPRCPYRRLEGYLVRMLDGGPVLVPGGGDAIARHVFAQDVAETLCALLGDTRAFGRAYNVAAAETPTVWEFVGRLAQRLGAPDRRVAIAPERLRDIPPTAVSPLSGRWMSLLDPARAVAELGLRHRPLDAWLDATIAAYLAAPPTLPPEGYIAHRARERHLANG
jgi:nucleoside-diphosphate-sugar epimerase